MFDHRLWAAALAVLDPFYGSPMMQGDSLWSHVSSISPHIYIYMYIYIYVICIYANCFLWLALISCYVQNFGDLAGGFSHFGEVPILWRKKHPLPTMLLCLENSIRSSKWFLSFLILFRRKYVCVCMYIYIYTCMYVYIIYNISYNTHIYICRERERGEG